MRSEEREIDEESSGEKVRFLRAEESRLSSFLDFFLEEPRETLEVLESVRLRMEDPGEWETSLVLRLLRLTT